MKTHERRAPKHITLIGTAFVAAAFFGMAGPVSAGPGESFHGTFNETEAGHDLRYYIHGSAKMTVGSDNTAVKVNISGLDASKTYGSHLHNGSCASGGGGHYQNVVSSDESDKVPPNELWLTTSKNVLVPNKGGVAHGSGSATWAARTSSSETNALSVVVHGGSARIACADLR